MSDIIICLFGESAFDRAGRGVAGAGQRLAREAGGALKAVVGGVDEEAARSELSGVAAEVLLAPLEEYQPEIWLTALTEICRTLQPRAILLGGDTGSLEVAPRLAHRLGGSSLADVAAVEVAGDSLRVTRSAYGGKAIAVYEPRRTPAVLCLRAWSFAPAEPDGAGIAISRASVEMPAEPPTRIVERNTETVEGVRLEDATSIVAGGRGLGGAEEFDELRKLAGVIGAALGASRVACDEGWAPPSWQIGQTGKKVAPDLYIAVGISGSAQHVLGMADSKVIAAINTDRDAPIFEHCAFGLAEDYRKAVPLLAEKLAALKK